MRGQGLCQPSSTRADSATSSAGSQSSSCVAQSCRERANVCCDNVTPRLNTLQVLNEDIGQQGAQYTAYTQLVVYTNGPSSQGPDSPASDGHEGNKLGAVAGAVAGLVVGAIATKLVAKL